jgi:hypothetical protein
MAFNSIWLRDFLRERNKDPIALDRRDPHRNVIFSLSSHPNSGEISLNEPWQIKIHGLESNLQELIKDFTTFLEIMNVALSDNAQNEIIFDLYTPIQDGIQNLLPSYKIEISTSKILISSSSVTGLWLGVVELEQEMRIRRGPFLPKGIIKRTSLWQCQISQAPYGANFLVPDLSPEFLSNDVFRLLIHFGITGMFIYGDMLCYAHNDHFSELEMPSYLQNIAMLKDASERASLFGIKLYYVVVSPKLAENHLLFQHFPEMRGALMEGVLGKQNIHNLCSSSEKSLQFHAEYMENLFHEVPLLGGVILIIGGESYYHCYMNPAKIAPYTSSRRTNCASCVKKSPEEIVSHFVSVTANAVHRVQPNALVMAWPYSASKWSKEPNQIEFIKLLPKTQYLGLLSEIDKDQLYKKKGYSKMIWDYSVDFTGPSDRIVAQTQACKKREIPYFIKSETAFGLEFIHLPYVPCLYRSAEKWKHVRDLHPNGVLQAWMFFGMWGSRSEELGWWIVWHPEYSIDEILNKIATRDFGLNAPLFLNAWQKISEAVGHIPWIPPYYVGPEFLGPAHPLIPARNFKLPDAFTGALMYQLEREESTSTGIWQKKNSLVHDDFNRILYGFITEDIENAPQIFIEEYHQASVLAGQAFQEIASLKDELINNPSSKLSSREIRILEEEIIIIEFFYRTLLTCYHTYKFLWLRDSVEWDNDKTAEMELYKVVELELRNLDDAIILYEKAPFLDLQYRYDGKFASSLVMIQEKRQIIAEYFNKY